MTNRMGYTHALDGSEDHDVSHESHGVSREWVEKMVAGANPSAKRAKEFEAKMTAKMDANNRDAGAKGTGDFRTQMNRQKARLEAQTHIERHQVVAYAKKNPKNKAAQHDAKAETKMHQEAMKESGWDRWKAKKGAAKAKK
jgi:hypothetical protein